jgi:uncharacterized protein YkwD
MRKMLFVTAFAILTFIIWSCSETAGPNCNNTLPAELAKLYDCGPDTTTCWEGQLKPDEKIKVMDMLNKIRALHGLQEITYNPDIEKYAQKAALITCANEYMNHYPPGNEKCYSVDAYIGCKESNLWFGYATYVHSWLSENMVVDWLIDDSVESLGHRRWLLNPFMREVAYGRVDKVNKSGQHFTAGALKVILDSLDYWQPFESNIEYVAYPQGEYPVYAFKLDWYLSFSLVADKQVFWNNNKVDYSSAAIQMTDQNGTTVAVNSIKYNTDGYGLPNIIQWKAVNLQANITYTVTISNLIYDGTPKGPYTYTFKLGQVS